MTRQRRPWAAVSKQERMASACSRGEACGASTHLSRRAQQASVTPGQFAMPSGCRGVPARPTQQTPAPQAHSERASVGGIARACAPWRGNLELVAFASEPPLQLALLRSVYARVGGQAHGCERATTAPCTSGGLFIELIASFRSVSRCSFPAHLRPGRRLRPSRLGTSSGRARLHECGARSIRAGDSGRTHAKPARTRRTWM